MQTADKLLASMAVAGVAIMAVYAMRVLPHYWPSRAPETPSSPVKVSARPSDFWRGNPQAPASRTIIEFGDIECQYCARIDSQLVSLMTADPSVKIVWKDCPLPAHANAERAAEAARCAGRQGKFWEYRDLLFSSENRDDAFYLSAANGIGLDQAAFSQCLAGGEEKANVRASLGECADAGVKELPWFVLDGKNYSGGNAIADLTADLKSR